VSRRIKTSLLCSQKKYKNTKIPVHALHHDFINFFTNFSQHWLKALLSVFFIYFIFASRLNHKIKKWTPRINTQQENEMMETLKECLNTFFTFIRHFVRGICVFIFTKSNFMNNYSQLCKFLILWLALSYFSDWMSKLE